MKTANFSFFFAILFYGIPQLTAQPKELRVQVDKPGSDIKSTMWGIFFEDINMAADGGIYAELVKNRSFEFNQPLMGWTELNKGSKGGSLLVINRGADYSNNPRFLRVKQATEGNYGLANEGFRGMGVIAYQSYDFSVLAKLTKNTSAQLRIELVNAKVK
jgi:alpha-L-arabinofuranosidase